MTHRLVLSALALMAVSLGCQKTVTIRAVEPAVKEISGIQRVAVLDLAYPERADVGRDLANMIVAEMNQTGAFDVMERSAVARVLQEQQFTAAGMSDAGAVSAIGKLLGVDGVIVGEIVAFDAGNEALGKYAMVGANLRLVDVRSAQVVFSDSNTINYNQLLDDKRKATTLGQLSRRLATDFVAKIAPHYVERTKFLLGAGGDASKPNSIGIQFATNGLWDKAQEQFERARSAAPDEAGVHNNLAVCHEHFGRINDAIQEYEIALKLKPDNDAIQKNLASLRGTLRPADKTAKQTLDGIRQDAEAKPAASAPSR